MKDILEMAQGQLTRVIAVRLRPGTDVLAGLTEACSRAGISNGVILSAIGSLDLSLIHISEPTRRFPTCRERIWTRCS